MFDMSKLADMAKIADQARQVQQRQEKAQNEQVELLKKISFQLDEVLKILRSR